MQQIKKLSFKLFIHYSHDWESDVARTIHRGKRQGTVVSVVTMVLDMNVKWQDQITKKLSMLRTVIKQWWKIQLK